MPLIILAWVYILYDNRIFSDWRIWAISFPLLYGIGLVSWFMHYQYNHYVISRFPSLEQTAQRIRWKALVNFIVMTPSGLFILLVYDWFHILGYELETIDLVYGYLNGLAVNIIFETLWEVLYIIDKYRESATEQEMLEKLHLEQEFDNLKQKVNPHFLFNCFNTLSSLITEDKKMAEEFLDELSKVYRYLLRNNESGMSTVEQEVNFIQSYYQLLKTRHGDSFQMYVKIAPGFMSYELPALSLQLLVENAVKHNVVSKQEPIAITITSTEDGYLVIENNLVKKISKPESTGIGLTNIREKYRLLRRYDIRISELNNRFVVVLPLIPGLS
ncbi:sensor histidine kinase [Chitinophaga sp. SYP-B3965]|uniref:sensor histidine kinase n=1 Tax=Chitinophaga sp. SYP-B3965 TaxID=2663120 RepID=UPI001562F333|nr:histidine kinase [Chitinophaga sp. SYP-B3965]